MNKLIIAFALATTAALALSQGETILKKILIAFAFVTAAIRIGSLTLSIQARQSASLTRSYEDKLCED